MALPSIRPSISNLVFHFYGRSVHPELFQIRAQTEVKLPTFEARISIADAGHIIEFRKENRTIATEIVATDEQPLPTQLRLLERKLRGTRVELVELPGGVLYQTSYQLEKMQSEDFLHFHEELIHDCRKSNLSHQFPSQTPATPQAVSLIRTDRCSTSLSIHTYHSYPEHFAVVKSQTLLEFLT